MQENDMRTLLGAVLLFFTMNAAAVASCYCDETLPLFEEDPLVFAGEGLVPYVIPSMVSVNEGGECVVANANGYYEGESKGSFFFYGEEFELVEIYTNNFSESRLADMSELNDWALEQCALLEPMS